MSNREKIGWGVGAAVLILLFLLSSTDLIIKEKKKEIYPISVILDDTNDEYYGNLKKGMDMAAKKYQADVNYITLYEEHDGEQQMELAQREIRDGARAVILAPVSEKIAAEALESISPRCPVVFLDSSLQNSFMSCVIGADQYEMGRKLAKKAAENENPDVPVCLLTEGLSYTGHQEIYDGIRSVLDPEGFTVRLVEKKDEDTFRQVIEETVYPSSGEITLIAMDTDSLSETAGIIAGSSVYQKQVTGLYGIGSTIGILNGLDKGIIKGIMVWNQFDMGYLSVEKAVESIQGAWPAEKAMMETYYIEAEDLHAEDYERMLYPKE